MLTALAQKLFASSEQFPEKSEPERFGEDCGCKAATNRNWKKGTTQSRGETEGDLKGKLKRGMTET